MYQAFLYIAFLAFCSAAPYTDISSARSFPIRQDQQIGQKPLNVVDVQQQDETDLVDTLGSGYSFFKKQPIVSRPLAQQKLASSEQQVPITSFDDTPNQWSDYTRSSAFKQKSIQKPVFSGSNDFLIKSGFGQQSSAPAGFGNQQQDLSLISKTFLNQDQGAYGSGIAQDQPQVSRPTIQQQTSQLFQQRPLQPIQSLIRDFSSSYGQQQVQPIDQDQQQLEIPQQQQQQSQVFQQQPSQAFQQQQPSQNFQQQQPQQILRPLIRDFTSSYGQQQVQPIAQDQQQLEIPQQRPQQILRPLIRDFSSSYGQQQVQPIDQDQQQQQQLEIPQQQQQSQVFQQQPSQAFQQQPSQPFQQQQQLEIPQQQQQSQLFQQQPSQNFQQQQPQQILRPLIRDFTSSYGQQQVQPIAQDQQQLEIPQQQQSQIFQQQPSQNFQQRPQQIIRPLIRDFTSSYGQQQVQPIDQDQQQLEIPQQQQQQSQIFQQQPSQNFQQRPQQIIRPLIRDFTSSYGQQQVQPIDQDQQQQQQLEIPQQQQSQVFQQQPSQNFQQQPSQPFQQQQQMEIPQQQQSQPFQQQQQLEIPQQQQSQVFQQQPSQNFQQPQQNLRPLNRDFSGSYGQQDTRSTLSATSNNVQSQQLDLGFNDLTQQSVVPTNKPVFTQQQQRPLTSSVQISQPSWSFQQTNVPRSNSIVSSSSRFASQSQPTAQTSDSGSFGGW